VIYDFCFLVLVGERNKEVKLWEGAQDWVSGSNGVVCERENINY